MYAKLAVLVPVCLIAACASTDAPVVSTSIPSKLKPNANESLAMVVPAKGIQIYECRVKNDQSGVHEWAFVRPEAMLFDRDKKLIGRHYEGPHWEAADGSRISGAVKEWADAPNGAIPWLLLATRPVGAAGTFSQVSSIQRINTVGGVAPKDGCVQPDDLGEIAHIEYSADYYLFGAE
jgi:hypothetical protein